jgi:hypothetical protein
MRVFSNDATPLLNLSVKRADSASEDDRYPDSRPSWADVRARNRVAQNRNHAPGTVSYS